MQEIIWKLFLEKVKNATNPLISPLGMSILWSIMAEGSKGKTKKILCEIFALDSVISPFDTFKEKVDRIKKELAHATFFSDNLLKFSRELKLNESFAKKLNDSLRIEHMSDEEYSEDIQVILLNAIHLEAKWAQKFHHIAGKIDLFTLSTGKKVESLFIEQSNILGDSLNGYLRKEHFHAVQIPMNDKNLCVEIYLPYQVDGLNDVLNSLSVNALQNLGNEFEKAQAMEIVLPKFSITADLKLTEYAAHLGIQGLFQSRFDLSPMLHHPSGIVIRELLQRSILELDEEGIKASSVSVMFGTIGSLPKEFQEYILFEATHPFLYLIREKTSNAILFLGVFEEPQGLHKYQLELSNEEERAKWLKDTNKISTRMSMALQVIYLEKLFEEYQINDPRIQSRLDEIWRLLAIPEEKVDHLLDEFQLFSNWNARPEGIAREEHRSNQDIEGLTEIVFEEVFMILASGIQKNWLPFLLDCFENHKWKIPSWELFAPFQYEEKNAYGPVIHKEALFKKVNTAYQYKDRTPEQEWKRQQYRVIRQFKPKILQMSVWASVYLGIILINELIRKKGEYPSILRPVFKAIVNLMKSPYPKEGSELSNLIFYDYQTGFYFDNSFFSEKEIKVLIKKYPEYASVLEKIGSLLRHFEDTLNGKGLFNLKFYDTIEILESFVECQIAFPNLSDFTVDGHIGSNEFGGENTLNEKWIDQLIQ